MIFLLNKETTQRLKAVKRLIAVIKNFIGLKNIWLKNIKQWLKRLSHRVVVIGSETTVKSITSANRGSQKSLGQESDYVKGSMTSLEASLTVKCLEVRLVVLPASLLSVQKAQAKTEKNTINWYILKIEKRDKKLQHSAKIYL